MYNLLVGGNPQHHDWSSESRFSTERSRLFEYCDDGDAVSEYKDHIDRRKDLPSFLVYEGPSTLGRIVNISSIIDRDSTVDIMYDLDQRFPPIPIYDDDTYHRFGIIKYRERFRQHWAVKNIDLYQVVAETLAKTRDDVSSRVSDAKMDSFWGVNSRYHPRVFVSHVAEKRAHATRVAHGLENLGCKTFVAHDDIPPTREWRDEILFALNTMTHFVGLITRDFHNKSWTDQEIGFSFSRRDVKRIFVKLSDVVPQGLAGFEQALEVGVARPRTSWAAVQLPVVNVSVKVPTFRRGAAMDWKEVVERIYKNISSSP